MIDTEFEVLYAVDEEACLSSERNCWGPHPVSFSMVGIYEIVTIWCLLEPWGRGIATSFARVIIWTGYDGAGTDAA